MNHHWIVIVVAISNTMIEHSHENHAWVRFLSSGASSRLFHCGPLPLISLPFWLTFHWLQEALPRRWLKSGSGKNPSSHRLSHSCTLELIIRCTEGKLSEKAKIEYSLWHLPYRRSHPSQCVYRPEQLPGKHV